MSTLVTVSALDGGRLLDLIDAAGLGVEFSCRSGDCRACLVEVLEGGDRLLPPEARETAVLDVIGAVPARLRLACQARVRPGKRLTVLRPVK
jgi:ferredoxin